MEDKIREFADNLKRMSKNSKSSSIVWAVVKSVDWTEKTMVATGISDSLDYNDVILGIDSVYIKPEKGCKCIIGNLENQDAAWFIIYAEVIEEVNVKAKKVTIESDEVIINNGNNAGLVKNSTLVQKLNQLESKHNALADYIGSLPIPVSGAVSGPPVPAAVLGFKILTQTNQNELQNTKVKH
jgi:hypothetical protein